jgi:hypothetical protein
MAFSGAMTKSVAVVMLQNGKGGLKSLMKKVSPWMYSNGVNRTELLIAATAKFKSRATMRSVRRGKSFMIF